MEEGASHPLLMPPLGMRTGVAFRHPPPLLGGPEPEILEHLF